MLQPRKFYQFLMKSITFLKMSHLLELAWNSQGGQLLVLSYWVVHRFHKPTGWKLGTGLSSGAQGSPDPAPHVSKGGRPQNVVLPWSWRVRGLFLSPSDPTGNQRQGCGLRLPVVPQPTGQPHSLGSRSVFTDPVGCSEKSRVKGVTEPPSFTLWATPCHSQGPRPTASCTSGILTRPRNRGGPCGP